ncbi:putative cytochrome P450 [Helianthus annuus]|nr:putative cytochrome P450 [Helianthus annuus]
MNLEFLELDLNAETPLLAGRDSTGSTLSWLFYLIAKNPIAEDKIQEEHDTQLEGKCNDIRAIELSKLVYLHGVICETLRLFPVVLFEHKIPVQPDTLPSGCQADLWGKDCLEFKPERWFDKSGGIKHQPSYKFPAFNARPRSCLGKQMSFTKIKIVVATIVYRYHVELVEGHPVVLPSDSIILQMKYGMKVNLTKRSEV